MTTWCKSCGTVITHDAAAGNDKYELCNKCKTKASYPKKNAIAKNPALPDKGLNGQK